MASKNNVVPTLATDFEAWLAGRTASQTPALPSTASPNPPATDQVPLRTNATARSSPSASNVASSAQATSSTPNTLPPFPTTLLPAPAGLDPRDEIVFQSSFSVQLVHAVPVCIETLLAGIERHRFWAPRMTAFRESILVQQGTTDSFRLVSKLPEEILVVIEQHLKEIGRERGGLKSEEFYRRWIGEIWAERNFGVRYDLSPKLDEIEAIMNYLESNFSITMITGMPKAQTNKRRYPNTHVYLYLPWWLKTRIRQERGDEFDQFFDRGFAYEENGSGITKSSLAGREAESFTYNRVEQEHFAGSIIEQEYVTLTLEKILKINRAIRELELDVIELERIQYRLGDFWERELSRISSPGSSLVDPDLEGNLKADMKEEEKMDVIDRTRRWPSVVHEEYGKLWTPQFILKQRAFYEGFIGSSPDGENIKEWT